MKQKKKHFNNSFQRTKKQRSLNICLGKMNITYIGFVKGQSTVSRVKPDCKQSLFKASIKFTMLTPFVLNLFVPLMMCNKLFIKTKKKQIFINTLFGFWVQREEKKTKIWKINGIFYENLLRFAYPYLIFSTYVRTFIPQMML